MHRRGLPFALLALLAMAWLAGCSILPKPEPQAFEHYVLEPQIAPAVGPTTGAGPVLLVAVPQARADLDTPRMAYRQQDFDIRYFARSRWAETPPQLLLPGLAEALEQSGRFAAVLRAGSPATPGLRLDTELLDFSQDFRTRPSEFTLRLRVQLVDLTGRRVVASRIFEVRRAAPEESPYGGVQAANAAWQALLPEVVEYCIASLPAAGPR